MFLWWNGTMIFIGFQMVKWSNSETICFGHLFIDGDMVKLCCANMVKCWIKISLVKWIKWWYLTVAFVIRQDLVLLNFFHNVNAGDPDNYSVVHLYYLWILLLYPLLCPFTFMYYTTENWCNSEIIPYGGAIIVWQFWLRRFFNCLLLEWISPQAMSQGISPGAISGDISFPGKTLGMKFFPGDVLG